MIVEWLLSLVAGISGWFASLFPTTWDVPPEIAGFDDTLNTIFGNLDGVSAWVDWTVTIGCVGLVLTTWVIGFGIKIIRTLASHLPLVGGAG